MLLCDVAAASLDVAATSSRLAKVARLAEALERARPEEMRVAVSYLSGVIPQGAIGVGWAALREPTAPAQEPTLELLEVDATMSRLRVISGAGSKARRADELAHLLGRATEPEQRLLVGLFLGELRQGALEGVMTDAVARVAGVEPAAIRRAAMVTGDLPAVAEAVAREGSDALAGFQLEPLRPVGPMLAQTADDVETALARVEPSYVEWKLDGVRIQAHRAGDEIAVYTRNLADITARVPEIVEVVRGLDVSAVVLDGEAIALRDDGRPYPFQVTMSRFGTKAAGAQRALSVFFFDCIYVDGEDLSDRPARERLARLDASVPPAYVVPRLEAPTEEEARRFVADTLARGHEGVMVKSLDGAYEAGRRGAGWLKVKPAHTLDLVVLAAEWGHGRRQGKLSNLHLGARDPASGGFVMLGKTFKGMTDALLAWQTERLLELETHREGHVVHVRPELVVEIAFDGVQSSTRYPGGMALRFARVKGYRPDKPVGEADTVETLRCIHEQGE
jgi:DNA ligase-1